MIGLVLVTHGRLAVEFRAALEHVVGPQTQIETVSIGPDDNVERRRQDIVDAVQKADDGSGVILLTDMFGGTPSNLAISVMDAGKVEVVAGVNLPMLIRALTYRDKSLQVMITKAISGGCEGVLRVPPVFTTVPNAATGS